MATEGCNRVGDPDPEHIHVGADGSLADGQPAQVAETLEVDAPRGSLW